MAICEEVEINLTRTAYSPLIFESKDYAATFLTRDFRVLAQSGGSIPIFVAGLGEPVADAVSLIGENRLDPGDVLITNFSDVSGQHINNVIAATPLFDDEGLVAYLAIKSHWADLGGLRLGGQSFDSRSVHHDGAGFRGLRVMRRGEVVPEVLATVQANTWQPEIVTGDLMAQLAGCSLVARRWKERVGGKWTPADGRDLIEAQLASSRAVADAFVERLPDGEYESANYWAFEHAGASIELDLKLKMRIDGARMDVDLTEMPDQVDLPINSGAVGGALSAMRLAFRLLCRTDWPVDDGFFGPLEVRTRPNTVVSAGPAAPICHWNTLMPLLIELFLQAIGRQHPDLVPASHHAAQGLLMLSGVREDGRAWWHAASATGGLGADQDADGFGPVKNIMLGDSPNIPVELLEARFPLVVRSLVLDHEAGGTGCHRGGPATVRPCSKRPPITWTPTAGAVSP